MADPRVRPARCEDAPAIEAIYAFHVSHGTATFDTEAPGADFWRDKVSAIQARGWPFLVIERDGEVLGYAYAAQFRDRAAYARTCENSIYIADGARGSGLGARLLAALLDGARECGFEQMIAVIGGGEPASVGLHGRLGFVEAGRMRKVGFKFGHRLDTVYMQRDLTREGETP